MFSSCYSASRHPNQCPEHSQTSSPTTLSRPSITTAPTLYRVSLIKTQVQFGIVTVLCDPWHLCSPCDKSITPSSHTFKEDKKKAFL